MGGEEAAATVLLAGIVHPANPNAMPATQWNVGERRRSLRSVVARSAWRTIDVLPWWVGTRPPPLSSGSVEPTRRRTATPRFLRSMLRTWRAARRRSRCRPWRKEGAGTYGLRAAASRPHLTRIRCCGVAQDAPLRRARLPRSSSLRGRPSRSPPSYPHVSSGPRGAFRLRIGALRPERLTQLKERRHIIPS